MLRVDNQLIKLGLELYIFLLLVDHFLTALFHSFLNVMHPKVRLHRGDDIKKELFVD